MTRPKKSRLYLYHVANGEIVTFEITPQDTNPTGITFSSSVKKVGGSDSAGTQEFAFTAQGGTGRTLVRKVEFSFRDAKPGARFDIGLRGSKGGEKFVVDSVLLGDSLLEREFTFKITS